ncbi:MAG: hypothetical protein ACXVEB_06010 [Bacteroidia bacterium]
MFKKATFLAFFALLLCIKSYSQDSTTATHKVLYKISPSKAKSLIIDEKRFETISKQNKSVYSCEIDSVGGKAIISVVNEKGVITKETFLLKDK